MKKALVIFILALFVATGAFAQVTVSGQLRTNFGLNMALEDFDFDQSAWRFDMPGGDNWIQARGAWDNAWVWVRVRPVGGAIRAGSQASFSAFDLRLGLDNRMYTGSSINFFGESNYGMGSTSLNALPYIEFHTGGFYAGLISTDTLGVFDNSLIPAFYAGYDLNVGAIGLNLGFAGAPHNDEFPLMGKVAVNFNNLGPVNQLRATAGVYMNPAFAGNLFDVTLGFAGANGLTGNSVDDDNLIVVEGMVSAVFNLAIGSLNLAAGAVTNFHSDIDGIALRVGAGLTAPLTGGLSIRPGIIYQTVLDKDDTTTLSVGATFQYNF